MCWHIRYTISLFIFCIKIKNYSTYYSILFGVVYIFIYKLYIISRNIELTSYPEMYPTDGNTPPILYALNL